MSSINLTESTSEETPEQEETKLKLKESIHDNLGHLSGFKLKEILQNSTNRKAIFLKGSFEFEEGEAVVILEKSAFSEENFLNGSGDYFPGKNHLEKIFQNDIYGDYNYITDSALNSKLFVQIYSFKLFIG